jgi:hypothetical protein
MKKYLLALIVMVVVPCISWASYVKISGNNLFEINHGYGELSKDERSQRASLILDSVLVELDFSPDSIKLHENKVENSVIAGTVRIISVTHADTQGTGLSRSDLALRWTDSMREAIKRERIKSLSTDTVFRFILLFLYPAFLVSIYILVNRYTNKAKRKIAGSDIVPGKGFRIGRVIILSPEKKIDFFMKMLTLLKWAFLILVLYISLFFFLNQFNQTSDFIVNFRTKNLELLSALLQYSMSVGKVALLAILLFFVVRIIFALTRFVMRHYSEVSPVAGYFSEKGFEALLKLTRRAVIILFLISLVYIIPGAKPIAMALLLILITVSMIASIGVLKDINAGYVILSRGYFRTGYDVTLAGLRGYVEKITFVHTYLVTKDQVKVFIHNNMIISSPIIVHGTKQEQVGNEEDIIL